MLRKRELASASASAASETSSVSLTGAAWPPLGSLYLRRPRSHVRENHKVMSSRAAWCDDERRDPKDMFSNDGLFDELKKALAERVSNAELDDHLEGEAAAGKSNHRNGYSKKTVLTETSKIDVKLPRDREGSFDPKLIARYQRRFPGFDEKIISMSARGMTVREIQGHLMELYGLEVSPDLISTIPKRCWRRSPNGRTGRSRRCILWFSSTRCASKSATRDWCATRPFTSRSASRRTEPRIFSVVGSKPRRRQILAAGHERAQKSWRRGHPHRRCRRPEGLSGGDQRGFPADDADLPAPCISSETRWILRRGKTARPSSPS